MSSNMIQGAKIWTIYGPTNTKTGIAGYRVRVEDNRPYLDVKFRNGDMYRYTVAMDVGIYQMAELLYLAYRGNGLNTLISQGIKSSSLVNTTEIEEVAWRSWQ